MAVTSDELRNISVAELIQEPSMFESAWNGHVGILPARSIPVARRRKPPQGLWNALAGHRDWAKVWIDRWARHDGQSSFVIVPGEADVMALFAEALALLPSHKAEQVTFITRLNADRAGVHFDWVGLTAGSELAGSILARHPERTLDLTRPLGLVPSSAVPKRQATASSPHARQNPEIRQPVVPGYDDPAIGSGRDEPRHSPTKESPVPRPTSPLVPPPPPPPEGFFKRNPAAIVIVAGITLATVLGLSAAWLWLSRPRHEASADTPPKALASGIPVREPSPNGGQPQGSGSTDDRNRERRESTPDEGNSHETKPKPTATVGSQKTPRIVHLNGWLPEIASKSNGKPGDWIEGYDLRELRVPSFSQLKLLSPSELDLKAVTLTKDDGKSVIEVGLTTDDPKIKARNSSIAFRLEGQKLEVQRPSQPSEDLLDRLQFCVVQIDVVQIDPSVDAAPSMWVMLTPLLPVPPLSDSETMPREWTGATGFFAAAHTFRERLYARIRVDRISLSILPRENGGWQLLNPKAEAVLGTELTHLFEITLPKGRKWPATLKVWTDSKKAESADLKNDDTSEGLADSKKDDKSFRPLVARVEPSPSATDPPTKKNDTQNPKGLGSLEPSTKAKLKSTRKKAGSRLTDTSEPKNSDENPTEAIEKTDDGALLVELFRRYGRIHGSVVITVKQGQSNQDIEVLRFDNVPDNARP